MKAGISMQRNKPLEADLAVMMFLIHVQKVREE